MQHKPMRYPIAYAMRESFSRGYSLPFLLSDLGSGFVVSLVALPLSMALAIAVGLPPQHGLYTAIVAGIAVALFGGSRFQVSGPTAAFVVILAPIVSEFGLRGLIWCGIMAGVMLIVFAISGLGKLMRFIPYPVTTGFTAGIAVVLGLLALNDFFGLGIQGMGGLSFIEKMHALTSHMMELNADETIIGILTLGVIFAGNRWIPYVPAPMIGMVVGTITAFILNSLGYEIATIASTFTYANPDGVDLPGIPPYPPTFHLPTLAPGELLSLPTVHELQNWIAPAATIAALAALESLLSATIADSMTGTRHHPSAELAGIGIGNILSAMVAGIPATGAIARTAANIHSGAKTPLSSVFHALFILLYIMLLAPYVAYVPMASLAALLMVIAWRMSHLHQCLRTLQIAPTADKIVLLTCFTLTVVTDMVMGVTVGLIMASFLFMQRVATLMQVDVDPPRLRTSRAAQNLPQSVLLYRMEGPLFFGTVEKAFDRASNVHDQVRTLIIDMENVPLIDMTGLVALRSLIERMVHDRRKVIICARVAVLESIKRKLENMPENKRVYYYANLRTALDKVRKKK